MRGFVNTEGPGCSVSQIETILDTFAGKLVIARLASDMYVLFHSLSSNDLQRVFAERASVCDEECSEARDAAHGRV